MLNKMKNTVWVLLGGTALFWALSTLAGVVWGGPLDPPGPPGSTMKTLEEVEPRTPISSLPYTISAPGSYYLTGNLTGVAGSSGITISSSGPVTLDLNGFTLWGVPGSLDGIVVTSGNVRVRDGVVILWGGDGIDTGIGFSFSSVENVGAGFNGGNGIVVGYDGSVSNCLSLNNGGIGILAGTGNLIENCQVEVNGSDGIQVAGATNVIVGNRSYTNGAPPSGEGAGIHVASGLGVNRIEGNQVVGNVRGINVDSSYNLIIKNSAGGNTTANYDIVGGNDVGPIGTAAASTSPWANISY